MASLSASMSSACQGTQGVIKLNSVSDAPGAPAGGTYAWTVVQQASGTDYGGPVSAGDEVLVPDGTYAVQVLADYPGGSTAASSVRTYTVACAGSGGGGGGGGGCDLVLGSLTPHDPASVGGLGSVSVTYTTAAASVLFRVSGPVTRDVTLTGQTAGQLPDLPAGAYTYLLRRLDQPDCQLTGDFVLTAPVPVDPSLNAPAHWEPVGGVLPNPVLLQVEASLTDALGAPRPGLHVELELWRPGAAAAFASFRATVRTATQVVDAAPYLRAELLAAQRYPASAGAPLLDGDAALRFTYRFRVVDRTGADAWQMRAGQRWAVLAALPGAADTLAPFVADGAGRVASVFPGGGAVQTLGYPLEATVLLPPVAAGTPRYVELRYLDAGGAAVDIRSWRLPEQAAGLLRLPLPADALPCAHTVEVSIRTDDRAFVGTCGGTVTPPTHTPGALLSERGRLLR